MILFIVGADGRMWMCRLYFPQSLKQSVKILLFRLKHQSKW
jgi:hypothetical protein